ncbi:ribosome maturation factor RimM [Kocuria varians]|uniref:Ribosome maturation factor RimM n=1 Tax=Kocuria varians TaxID=1272 RepID=A0A4Y4D3L3_KOCVA|nr:ribosome maturation factor RimM [Kocuria varians]GEC99765.1 ribosome maturation factor RimM [Kocuria varians]
MSVRVARIGKPHGVRGEVTVELFTDDPEARFSPGSVLEAKPGRAPRGAQQAAARGPLRLDAVTVVGSRWNKDVLVARFEEIGDRTAAESARGLELFAEVADLELEDDEWHQDDLLGLSVVDATRDDAVIGTVRALIQGSAQDLLEVSRAEGGSPALIPFVAEIVPEVDLDRGVVVVTPPPGLLELGESE